MPDVTPHPKDGARRRAHPSSGGRIVRLTATREYLHENPRALCAVCGRLRESVHHFIPKGSPHFGDDVFCNFIPVCGHGSAGCHGAFHGTPCNVVATDGTSFRVTKKTAGIQIGRYVLRHRPDVLLYVGEKLGATAGAAFLERVYHVTFPN